ncbi:MAG: LysM peptidoglycan-binding domain-containing protein [Rhodocyclaceae bacterium]|nr:LysM peptidoglycan-binding domain-containing protein [Rhodocyclaceae bacterium]MBX3667832.1 LysM peptidoglycan-binding domain-containing protein [Rhodocyclaceae bacterium]
MRKIIAALALAVAAGTTVNPVSAAATSPIQLADNAPDRHVVVRGDTLWGIAAMFLKDPWRWPEVWRLNQEQIRDPHWIYPGQVVYLDRSDGTPRLRIGNPVGSTVKLDPKIYETSIADAIPTIPQQVIEPFLLRPLVVEPDFNTSTPKIVGTDENRVWLSAGDAAFVTGLQSTQQRWQAFRPATPIQDPQTKEVLGYEAHYLGELRLVRSGDPAELQVLTAKEEIGRNDRLVPAEPSQVINYVPHAPVASPDGHVLQILGGVLQAGRYSVLMIDRGRNAGVEVGHVLATYRDGEAVRFREEQKVTNYKLPPQRTGLIFVFRVYDRVSFALVMNSYKALQVGDSVVKPDVEYPGR